MVGLEGAGKGVLVTHSAARNGIHEGVDLG